MSIFRRLMRPIYAQMEPKKIYKGSDQMGNKYYEIPPQKYMFGTARHSKLTRKIEPYEQMPNMSFKPLMAGKDLPVEWDAWLRNKRDDVPTEEEIMNNEIKAAQTKQRVEYLKTQEEKKNSEKLVHHSSTHSKKHIEEVQEVDSWSPDNK